MEIKTEKMEGVLSLSVVIPVYNEKESLTELLARIVAVCQSYEPYEIICVDDGSTDGSFELLENLKLTCCPQLVIIKFSANAGQSAALAAGLQAARGDIIVMIDADLQNPPEAIPVLLKNMEGVDAVVGWRRERHDPLIKRLGSYIANVFRQVILEDHFHDNGCTLKAFRHQVVSDLMMFKGAVVFFPNLIQIAGYSIREICVPHEQRKYGRSKYKKFSFSGIKAFFDTLFVLGLKRRRISYKIEKVIS
jgi:glycosyltransferase involved in cell wall biosynthesis